MSTMLLALALALASDTPPPPADSGFASCFILFRSNEGKSVAYVTGAFPSTRDVSSHQREYLDPFVKFLASKYSPNGSGTVQAGCNWSGSASDAQQMSEEVLGSSSLNANSIVRTDWRPSAAPSQDGHSANWEHFSGNGPDFIYIDRQSVTQSKDGFTIWVKSENSATDPGAYALLFWKVDCKAWELNTISGTGYFPNGKVIAVPPRLHEPMPPNTVGNGLAKTFCPKP